MIGNPKWFGRRKYTGWGLTPATWQGWAYIGVSIVTFIIINHLPIEVVTQRLLVFVWAGILGVDILDMMIRLRKDEREKIHEALAERNAAWIMILALSLGFGYQVITSSLAGKGQYDPVILIALFLGVIAKAATNWYLRNK